MNTTYKKHSNRPGFTLLELTITGTLSAFLMLMVAGMWTGLGRSLAENVQDASVTGEAALALETLRRDFGGHLPGDLAGDKENGQLVGRLLVGDDQLMLCYDGAPINGTPDWAAPDVVITYAVQDGQLVRTDSHAGTAFVVADRVEDFTVTDVGTGVQVELTLDSRNVHRTYTLLTQDPE